MVEHYIYSLGLQDVWGGIFLVVWFLVLLWFLIFISLVLFMPDLEQNAP